MTKTREAALIKQIVYNEIFTKYWNFIMSNIKILF